MRTPLIEGRRRLLKGLASLSVGAGASHPLGLGALGLTSTFAGLAGCTTPQPAGPVAAPAILSRKLGRVGVIGAGFGGATAARYLKHWGGSGLDVVLIERQPQFVSCPLSNLVLGGSRRIEELTLGYQGLREAGVTVLVDEVTAIDPVKKRVSLVKIADQEFDRLVVSPGVDFQYDQIQGLGAEAQKTVLHAWKAGPQTVELRNRIEAMPDGGVFVLSIPRAPYRCPPGPYERVCQVAFALKAGNPKAKIIVLDANEDIQSKKGLFLKAWEAYGSMIEYRPNSAVSEIDAKAGVVTTEFGDRIRADVLNVIPPHRAADLAQKTGLITVNQRWCGVDWLSMESVAQPGIHVLGDAVMAAPLMPKSGHMANQHGKVAAAAILELLQGRAPQPGMVVNTCYSYVDDRNVVHVASVHRYNAEKKTMETVAGSGGLSSQANALEGQYADSWARNIWRDMFNA